MSRVLTFSRTFPAYHPRKGDPTYFVEKIWNWLVNQDGYSLPIYHFKDLPELASVCDSAIMKDLEEKGHTIRAGNRWKVGDKFSPRVWSGKPYASKQIIIAPDIEVKKVWDFEIVNVGTKSDPDICLCIDGSRLSPDEVRQLAINDGLSFMDLMDWLKFPKPFTGHIICWNENINY